MEIETMPDELCEILHGHTLNQAIAAGLIDDLGNAEGNLFANSDIFAGTIYALVNGYAVQCSVNLLSYPPAEIQSMLGDLTFFRWKAGDNYFFRLGRPNKLNLIPTNTINIKSQILQETETISVPFHSIILEPSQTPNAPEKGMIYYDSELNKLLCYDGNKWNSCW